MPAVATSRRPALFLVGAAACWGLAAVISKRAVSEIAPLVLLPVQLVVSVAFLLLFTGRPRRGPGNPVAWSPGLRRLTALGVLNPGAAYALSLLGLVHITATLSVLLWALEPVVILLLAWAVLGERVSRPLLVAGAAALGGVMLLVFDGGSAGNTLGVALTLAGVAACAVYTVACRRLLMEDSTLVVVILQQLAALAFALCLLAAVAVAGEPVDLRGVSAQGWASAAVSGVLYYGLAFWLYLTGLRAVPASVAGLSITLVPLFGIAAGALLLGERLTLRQWAGAVVVLLAVVAVIRIGSGVSIERRQDVAP